MTDATEGRDAALVGQRPFVLVSGTWHGGWCWKKVRPLLEAAGAPVYTPTLTGVGERFHLTSSHVGLDTHITDVVNVARFEDLSEIVLVGHSYGGTVIQGIADTIPERTRRVVHLDGSYLFSGERLYPDVRTDPPEDVISVGDEGVLCLDVPRADALYGVTDPDDLAWMRALLTPHPLKTKTDPLILTDDNLHGLPQTFIACLLEADGSGRKVVPDKWPWTRVKAIPEIEFMEIESGHDVMVTEPKMISDILLELRRR